MFAVAGMEEIRGAVGAYAAGFDPALVSAAEAQRIVSEAVAAENMLATVRGLAARRLSETELWRNQGDRSPAHHLARLSGSSVSKAREALDTAGRLDALPQVEAAARRGELSPSQAAPIADAASKAPTSQERLLQAAKALPLGGLKDTCARTKAAAEPDDEARHQAIHRSRFLRRRRTADGAGELHYRSTPEEVAEIFGVVKGWAERRFRSARVAGRHEPNEAYLADGLLDAVRASRVHTGASGRGAGGAAEQPASDQGADDATGAGDGGPDGPVEPDVGASELFPALAPQPTPPAIVPHVGPPRPPSPMKMIVRVDLDALLRGFPLDGELCEVSGLGPVPVAAVRAMIASGNVFLAAVATKGADVVGVAHLGRRPTAHQQTALEWMSPQCTNTSCDAVFGLENDHRVPWADTKVTLVGCMDPLCKHCHRLKTHQGWALVEGSGRRPLVPPEDPRHPGKA